MWWWFLFMFCYGSRGYLGREKYNLGRGSAQPLEVVSRVSQRERRSSGRVTC